MENDAPAGLFQFDWINAETDSEHRRKQLIGMVKRARTGAVHQMTDEVFNFARERFSSFPHTATALLRARYRMAAVDRPQSP
jgi:hypothetical protein